MSTAEMDEFDEVMGRVKGWPPGLRIALAKGILESLQSSVVADAGRVGVTSKPPRGPSAEEVRRLLKTDRPAPDDETVERWIEEHRMEKYG